MSLLILLCACMNGRFCIENPHSSLIFFFHLFRQAVRMLKTCGQKAELRNPSKSSNLLVQIQFKQHVRDCSGAPKFCTLKKMTLARSTGYLCGCRTSSTQRLSQHCWWETLWAWVSCNHQRVKSGWRRQQLFQPLWNTLIKQESHVGKVVHGSNLLRYWDKKPWGS